MILQFTAVTNERMFHDFPCQVYWFAPATRRWYNRIAHVSVGTSNKLVIFVAIVASISGIDSASPERTLYVKKA